jgi:hypothetical protein
MRFIVDVVIRDDRELRVTIELIPTLKEQMDEERVCVRQIASVTRFCVKGFVM